MEVQRDDLTPEDWTDAGLRTLAEIGVSGVKIDRLAKSMNISRGSFYWHFKDLDQLMQSMVKTWLFRQRGNLKRMQGAPLDTRIEQILRHIRNKDAAADIAMRVWAFEDRRAAKAVQIIDEERHNLVMQSFKAMGFTDSEATYRATALYYFQIGDQMARKKLPRQTRKQNFDWLKRFLTS